MSGLWDQISDFMTGSRKKARGRRRRRDASAESCIRALVNAGYSPRRAAQICGQKVGIALPAQRDTPGGRKNVSRAKKALQRRSWRKKYGDSAKRKRSVRSVKICEKVYFAKWIQKAVPKARRGKLRKLLGMHKGETIPMEWKEQGCKNPRKTFYKLMGRIPTAKEAKHFQKMMCFARTTARIGKKRARKHARRAA